MDNDSKLIFEAFKGKPESADERKERVQRGWDINKNRWAKWKMENPEAAANHAAKKQGKSENAEHAPHGYPQGITAIQNLLINQLKKHGFTLTKISHEDKDRDAYPTVFMHKKHGPMHTVAEIDGMGTINGEPYKEYMQHLKTKSEDEETAEQRIMAAKMAVAQAKGQIAQAKTQGQMKHYGDGLTNALGKPEQAEDAESYSAMTHLTQAANEIRDILQTHADDEAQTEHIIRMAQIILGPKSDHTDAEYRKMLDGLIVILNRFIVVPMNG
jgi:hypothetical protein